MIALIDYGAGNLQSVRNTLEAVGAAYQVFERPEGLESFPKVILPGVGHFGQMLQALDARRLRRAVLDRVAAGVPLLGICVGLQCLFEGSEEAPGVPGLGLFPGTVRRFPRDARVPHMGWNSLDRVSPCPLLDGLSEHPYFYFAHSFYAPAFAATAASCTYHETYTAVLQSGSVYGVQFHPEKSGPAGIQVVRNFVEKC
jgi:imidazole glycerol phosphate synthase glutamine amidotransferase subunit